MPMPAGFTGADFYYILPEIVLTAGALVVLLVDLIARDRDDLTFPATLATLAVTAVVLLRFAGVDAVASRGTLGHRRLRVVLQGGLPAVGVRDRAHV